MSMNLLTTYNNSVRMLRAATSVVEARKVRDLGAGLCELAKIAGDKEVERLGGELRLRATRRIGQMLASQKLEHGLAKGAAQKGVGRRGKRGSANDPQTEIRLMDQGINKHLANQARKLARLIDAEFEKLLIDRLDGKRPKSGRTVDGLVREAGMSRREKALVEEEAAALKDLRALTPYICGQLEEDEVPAEFESHRQKFEWLLSRNPSSSNLPASVNTIHKIVADAWWRIELIGTRYIAQPRAALKIRDILDRMVERIDIVTKDYLKSRQEAEKVDDSKTLENSA